MRQDPEASELPAAKVRKTIEASGTFTTFPTIVGYKGNGHTP